MALAAGHAWQAIRGKDNSVALKKYTRRCLDLKVASTAEKSAQDLAVFPANEATCNKCLETAVIAAPTRASSFLEALASAKGASPSQPVASRSAKQKLHRVLTRLGCRPKDGGFDREESLYHSKCRIFVPSCSFVYGV